MINDVGFVDSIAMLYNDVVFVANVQILYQCLDISR